MKNILNNLQKIFNWLISQRFKKNQLKINKQQLLTNYRDDALDEMKKLIQGLNNVNSELKKGKNSNSIDFAIEINSICIILLENIIINLKVLENNQIIINMFPSYIPKFIDSVLKKTEVFAKRNKKQVVYDTDVINNKKMYYNYDFNKLSLILLNIIIDMINNSKEQKIQVFMHEVQAYPNNVQFIFILYTSAIIDNKLAMQELRNMVSCVKSIDNFTLSETFDDNIGLRLYIANNLIKALNNEDITLTQQQLNIHKINDHYVYWFKISLKKLFNDGNHQMLTQFSSSVAGFTGLEDPNYYESDEEATIIYHNNEASSSVTIDNKRIKPRIF